MPRQVFNPPPDDDDVIDVLAGRAPIFRPSPPKASPPVSRPTPPEPATTSVTAPLAPEPVAPRTVGKGAEPTRPLHTLPSPEKAPPAGPLRRVGLYLDLEQWARLNELQIEKARRSLPHDYTAIVVEALEAHYGKFERKRP